VLRVVGRVSSIVSVGVGPGARQVLAEEVERTYRTHCKLVRQVWCHGFPGGPHGLLAVVCVDHEQAYNWAAEHRIELPSHQPAEEAEQVMRAAKQWFEECGPQAGSCAMLPAQAFQNSERDWAVRYTLLPDTGQTFFQRFTFARLPAGGFVADGVSPEAPEESEREQEMDLLCRLPQLRRHISEELQRVHLEQGLSAETSVLSLCTLTYRTRLSTEIYRCSELSKGMWCATGAGPACRTRLL
jgi:hypothetical protein